MCAVVGGVLGQEVVKVNKKTQRCTLKFLSLQTNSNECWKNYPKFQTPPPDIGVLSFAFCIIFTNACLLNKAA